MYTNQKPPRRSPVEGRAINPQAFDTRVKHWINVQCALTVAASFPAQLHLYQQATPSTH